MLRQYLLPILIIFAVFAAWVLVQHVARVFAARHPELGPAREEGGACGTSCGCANRSQCRQRNDHFDTTEEAS